MFAQVELDREYRSPMPAQPAAAPLEGARAARHEDFERLEGSLRVEVLSRCVDESAPTVRIPFRGGYILARPLDTRRFVRAMARHISFN
jgi:hypothetical protein